MGDRKLFIYTFGCQMNVHDAEQIAALLAAHGYERTEEVASADLIVVNTCSIRRKAAEKAYSLLGRFQRLKQRNRHLVLAMGGCLAQQAGPKACERLPQLDIVFGTHAIHRLPALLDSLAQQGGPVVETDFHATVPSLGIVAPPPPGAVSAFVTIMQGCNNFCSFCVVPYLRGPEISRPSAAILAEVAALATAGVKEVTLLGQNVNSYGRHGGDGVDFSGLIRRLGQIDGIRRIRFTTSHPRDLSDELIRCFAEVEPLCEHIHLPVQSGSDRVLAAMNRGYTAAAYCARVDALRQACPGIAITSDVIVGFPGEQDEDFAATLRLMERVKFDGLFSFCYSAREGTAAASFPDQIEAARQLQRLYQLQQLQDAHTLAHNRAFEGCTEEVLVEGPSHASTLDMSGRTRTFKIVNFRADGVSRGQIVPVTITAAHLHSLRGELYQKEV